MKFIIWVVMIFMLPSVYAEVYINEIMYNPFGEDSEFEYLELFGNNSLENYSFVGINFEFPINSSINGYLVIAKPGFINRYGIEANYTFSGSLKNSGEEISLIFNNTTIDSVIYSNTVKEGYSLEFNGSNFVSSLVENGTPYSNNSIFNISLFNNKTINITNSSNSTNFTNTTSNNSTINITNTSNLTNSTANNTIINTNQTNSSINITFNNTTNSSINVTNETPIIVEVQEVLEIEEEEKLPVIQSFYTLTRKFIEDKEIKFFSTIHNKANSKKSFNVVFEHNGKPQRQSIILESNQKEKLTFIIPLFSGKNNFKLTLFDNSVAIDRKTKSFTAEAKEIKIEKSKVSKTAKEELKKVKNVEIIGLTEPPKKEDKIEKELKIPVESFKNDTPIQVHTRNQIYEGDQTKNKKIIGYLLLGLSAVFNIILIWRR